MTKSIILTGPKHSGKTSTGKLLASLRSCEFVDVDELIFQRTGKTPRQLYTEGQQVFRNAEAEAMETLVSSDKTAQRVIATGGGIIDNAEALAVLKKIDAKVVYLDIYANSAWDRISNSADGILPPALRTGNPQETHRLLHERRASAYLQIADIVIFADGKSLEEIAAEIIGLINSKE
ncbi:MAG: shikimate kinase [Treponema sp.]|nr:shikimate kinase [Treponema sp.]